MNKNINYIDNVEAFESICKYIRNNVDIIGIDTEFIRQHTYYPILCLIQLIYFDGNINNYKTIAIDTIKIKNITSFLKILKIKKIKKIFFSFSQDIDAFYFLTKDKINNVEDIQIMLEFCGYNPNIGYANCVEQILNIEFKKNKSLQISNWLERPLSNQQLKYAINDVIYLIPIYNYLLDLIKQNNNYDYYINEISNIIKNKNKKYLINNSWKKLKFNLHKKNISYVLLLKELCKWREEKAIDLNIIRHLVIDDYVLEILATHKPRSINELKLLYNDNSELIYIKKIYKKEILEIIDNFIINHEKLYKDDIFYTCEKGFPEKELLNIKYKEINAISNKLNISTSRTLSKMDIILIMMKYEKKRKILYGWKYNIFKNIFNKNIKK